MIKELFTYQSYEYLGEMNFVFTNCKLVKTISPPLLLAHNEFSSIEIDFLKSKIHFYQHGKLVAEKSFNFLIMEDKIKTRNSVVYFDPSLSKGYKHRFEK